MIAYLWFVKTGTDGFVASRWKQGHDGQRHLQPGFTGETLQAATIEDLRALLREKGVSDERTEKALASLQLDDPDVLELWW